MAFSIEARVPFLDHELVEFIFKLPIDQKIDGGWNRAVYRSCDARANPGAEPPAAQQDRLHQSRGHAGYGAGQRGCAPSST